MMAFGGYEILAAEEPEEVTNASIIEMKGIGLSETVMIEKIASSKPKFDLTVKGLKELKAASVPDPVISAMFAMEKATPRESPVVAPSNPSPASTSISNSKSAAPQSEHARRFNQIVSSSFTGDLAQKAFWQAKTDLSQVKTVLKRAMEVSEAKWQVLEETQPAAKVTLITLKGKGFLTTPRKAVVQLTQLEGQTDIRVAMILGDDPMRSPQRQAELRNWVPQVLSNLKKAIEQDLGMKVDGVIQNMDPVKLRHSEAAVAGLKANPRFGDVVVVSIEGGALKWSGQRIPIEPFQIELVRGEAGQAFFRSRDKRHAQPIQISVDNAGRSVTLDGFETCINQNWDTPQAAWNIGTRYTPKKKSYPDYNVENPELRIWFKRIP